MLAVAGVVAVAGIYELPPYPSLWPDLALDEHGTLVHSGAPATAAIVAALRASPPPGRSPGYALGGLDAWLSPLMASAVPASLAHPGLAERPFTPVGPGSGCVAPSPGSPAHAAASASPPWPELSFLCQPSPASCPVRPETGLALRPWDALRPVPLPFGVARSRPRSPSPGDRPLRLVARAWWPRSPPAVVLTTQAGPRAAGPLARVRPQCWPSRAPRAPAASRNVSI